MIVISKKGIMLVTSLIVICLFACNIYLSNSVNEKTKETVALPVTNKVIVVDARTPESQMKEHKAVLVQQRLRLI